MESRHPWSWFFTYHFYFSKANKLNKLKSRFHSVLSRRAIGESEFPKSNTEKSEGICNKNN